MAFDAGVLRRALAAGRHRCLVSLRGLLLRFAGVLGQRYGEQDSEQQQKRDDCPGVHFDTSPQRVSPMKPIIPRIVKIRM